MIQHVMDLRYSFAIGSYIFSESYELNAHILIEAPCNSLLYWQRAHVIPYYNVLYALLQM